MGLPVPERVTVQLVDQHNHPLCEPDILIALNTFIAGRYYYGSILGLTDAVGRATTTGGALLNLFHQDQGLFPMDYRVPLEECDPVIELVILCPEEVDQSRVAVRESYWVSPAVRDAYERARNARVAAVAATVALKDARPVVLELPTQLNLE